MCLVRILYIDNMYRDNCYSTVTKFLLLNQKKKIKKKQSREERERKKATEEATHT